MKPILILQHLDDDGPAYFGTWLAARGLAARVFNAEAGDVFPEHLGDYRALAILGGAMSANDALPSLRRAERLVRQAVAAGVPTLGHCLGGQLMARALGASVSKAPAPEIGWQPLTVAASDLAQSWLGLPGACRVFQWHFEAFDLPPGAQALASSPACPHQAFALGPHLALQFHVELDAAKLARWLVGDEPQRLRELAAAHATVQSSEDILKSAAAGLARQQQLADRLYARWLGVTGAE